MLENRASAKLQVHLTLKGMIGGPLIGLMHVTPP